MAYYLGRDVKVYLTSEFDVSIRVKTDGNLDSSSGTHFSKARDQGLSGALVTDLTGVDLGIGATDEDISFIGLRSVLKAEIKKETTLSLTRKKIDNVWDIIFNGDGTTKARWGAAGPLTGGSATNSYTGLEKPTQNYGYRIHIQLNTSGEVFTIRNATITGHSTSISVDGVQEETLEFLSHVDPKIGTTSSVDTSITGATEI
jgi:hypothetical protein